MIESYVLHRYNYDVPPGFEGHPFLFLSTLFSLLLVNIFALEWFWRILWGAWEQPHDWKHPVSTLRILLLLIGLSILFRSVPDTLRLAFWHELSPVSRLNLTTAGHFFRVVSVIPFGLAWFVGFLSMPLLHYQLDKQPLPLHLWPTRKQLQRPLKIAVAVLAISAAITFYG